jgi:hypothetical protein
MRACCLGDYADAEAGGKAGGDGHVGINSMPLLRGGFTSASAAAFRSAPAAVDLSASGSLTVDTTTTAGGGGAGGAGEAYSIREHGGYLDPQMWIHIDTSPTHRTARPPAAAAAAAAADAAAAGQ